MSPTDAPTAEATANLALDAARRALEDMSRRARLMIDTAVVMLVVFDRLPWVALIILLRDVLLVGGYKLVVPRGYEFEVSRLGKIATWGMPMPRRPAIICRSSPP